MNSMMKTGPLSLRCNLLNMHRRDPILIMPLQIRHPSNRAFFSSTVAVFFLVLTFGCGPKKNEVAIQTGNPTSEETEKNEKTTFDVPPLFSESQLKVGQWIEWQRTHASGAKDCTRWKIAGMTDSGIMIESRFSRKCVEPDNSHVEYIKFNPDTGKITTHRITDDGVPSNDNGALYQTSIFEYFYGYTKKVDFLATSWTLEKTKYPVFKIEGLNYYNNPKHPFHAFILTFQDGNSNKHQYRQSEPALEALPNTP